MNIKQARRTLRHYTGDLVRNITPLSSNQDIIEAIDTLTRFVDVVTGEPSVAMIDATITSYNENGQIALVSHAKAYIKQAEREAVAQDVLQRAEAEE